MSNEGLLGKPSKVQNYRSIEPTSPRPSDSDFVSLEGMFIYVDCHGKVRCTRSVPRMAPKAAMSEKLYEFPYMKPEKIGRMKTLRNALYDPKNHTIFGRTPKNWGGLFIFYSIFFSALALMFALCMYGMLSSLNPDEPTYKLEYSLIGNNPGLGYRPYSDNVDEKGALIWYVASNQTNINMWTSSLDTFLHDYSDRGTKGYENRVTCSGNSRAESGKVCDVPLESFGPCTTENGYSYNKSSPCIFIKLNRIFNWVPEFYNDSTALPTDMDEDLKNIISTFPSADRNVVWVSCAGESIADKENIGPIAFYPKQGFPGNYYPFTNTPGYLSPLVAVHLERPRTNTLINIECRAWAKNIRYARTRGEREGSVHIEVMVD